MAHRRRHRWRQRESKKEPRGEKTTPVLAAAPVPAVPAVEPSSPAAPAAETECPKEETPEETEEEKKAKERAAIEAEYSTMKSAWEESMKLREANLKATEDGQRGSTRAGNLDSSIKKINSFKAKLRAGDSSHLEQQGAKLNLRRFVSEIADAFGEGMPRLLRTAGMRSCVAMCSSLHQRYAEFGPRLHSVLLRVFPEKHVAKADAPKDVQEAAKAVAVRKRCTLKLLVELLIVGVLNDAQPSFEAVRELLTSPAKEDPLQIGLSLVVSFLKAAGLPLLQRVPSKLATAWALVGVESFVDCDVVKKSRRLGMLAVLDKQFDELVSRMTKAHGKLRELKKRIRREEYMRGSSSETLLARRAQWLKMLEKLDGHLESLADLLGRELPPREEEEEEEGPLVFFEGVDEQVMQSTSSPFEDEESRLFYEQLLELATIVPPVLLKGEAHAKAKTKARKEMEAREAAESLAVEADSKAEAEEEEKLSSYAREYKAKLHAERDRQEKELNLNASLEELEREAVVQVPQRAITIGGGAHVVSKFVEEGEETWDERPAPREKTNTKLDLLLQELPNALNREKIDKLAENFCYHNSKGNRARLVRELYGLRYTMAECVPYYARLAATLALCLPEIGDPLVSKLMARFFGLLRQGSPDRLESIVLTVRFLGELAKFGTCPDTCIFVVWRACLTTFRGQSIRVMAQLLDCCGRWLYLNPKTHIRCQKLLEHMRTLAKSTRYLDQELVTVVENAYFTCRPQTAMVKAVELTPVQRWIRHLLLVELDKPRVPVIVERLRKLPWDPPTRAFVLSILTQPQLCKFPRLNSLAAVVMGLNRFYGIGVEVADAILEELRAVVEGAHVSLTQHAVAHARYLGHLYIQRLVNREVILDTLYFLVTFRANDATVDPPTNTLRVSLLLALLDTIAPFFQRFSAFRCLALTQDRGTQQQRLHLFSFYFEWYLLSKVFLPIDLEFQVMDVWEKAFPGLERSSTVEELEQERKRFEANLQLKTKSSRGLKKELRKDRLMSFQEFKTRAAMYGNPSQQNDGLETIAEDVDEEEEEVAHEEEAEEEENEEKQEEEELPPRQEQEEAQRTVSVEEMSEFSRAGPSTSDTFGREDETFKGMFALMVQDSCKESHEAPPAHRTQAALAAAREGAGQGVFGSGGRVRRVVRETDGAEEEGVVFSLVARGSGAKKVVAHELFVPMAASLATNLVRQGQQRVHEQQVLKQKVVEGLVREEEEEREAFYQHLQTAGARVSVERGRGGRRGGRGRGSARGSTRGTTRGTARASSRGRRRDTAPGAATTSAPPRQGKQRAPTIDAYDLTNLGRR